MLIKDIVAVIIIFSAIDRIVFNFFAELFRLVGIYVGECQLEDEEDGDEDLITDSYQLVLRITENGSDGSDRIINIDPKLFAGLDMSVSNAPDYLMAAKNVLTKIQLWSASHNLGFPYGIISNVLPLYTKNNVLKGSMQLQYYRIKTELNREAEDIFQNTLNDLQKLGDTSKHLDYARIYCKQKINLACYFQNDRQLTYAVSELVGECDNLLDQYPEYSNVNVLKGMICERAKDGVKMAIDAYRAALPHIASRSCAAHVYYWLGILYEKYDGSHEDAVQAYERSYELKPKYRNI